MSKSEEETKKINLCDDMVMASPVSWSTDTNTDGTRRFQRRVNQKQIIMNFSEECNKLIPNIVGPFEVRLIRKEISKKNIRFNYPLLLYSIYSLYSSFTFTCICCVSLILLIFQVFASIGHWNTSVLVILALHLLPVWGVALTLLFRSELNINISIIYLYPLHICN